MVNHDLWIRRCLLDKTLFNQCITAAVSHSRSSANNAYLNYSIWCLALIFKKYTHIFVTPYFIRPGDDFMAMNVILILAWTLNKQFDIYISRTCPGLSVVATRWRKLSEDVWISNWYTFLHIDLGDIDQILNSSEVPTKPMGRDPVVPPTPAKSVLSLRRFMWNSNQYAYMQ